MAFRRKETRDVGAVFDVFKDPEQNAVHEQTDRQTTADGQATTYSEFTFAKN